MTWNCEKINPNKELELRNILESNQVSVASITETELDNNSKIFIPGYKTFYPLNPPGRIRVVLLVKDGLDVNDITVVECSGLPLVITRVMNITILAVYRQFQSAGSKESESRVGAFQTQQLDGIIRALSTASDIGSKIIIAGDINLDMARIEDPNYYNSVRLHRWLQAMEECGLSWLPTGFTYQSYGIYDGEHRRSTIDHIYQRGF